MLGQAGWITLGIAGLYLVLFFLGTSAAGRAASRSTWLFGRATGKARLAAAGFRLAFVLALAGPLFWLVVPALHKADPLWTEGKLFIPGLVAAVMAAFGAMIAFAAQMSMGASWRVGVAGAMSASWSRAGFTALAAT